MMDAHQSTSARLKAKLPLLLGGVVLIIAAFYTLSWNEQRVASTQAPTKKVAAPVKLSPISIPASPLNPANEGKVVVISGQATSNDAVADPGFDLNQVGLVLTRKVSMYQWQQIEKKNSDKTTTVNYKQIWSEKVIDASQFSGFSGGSSVYDNPKKIIIPPYQSVAKTAKIGDFYLDQALIKAMPKSTVIDMSAADLKKIQKRFQSPVSLTKSGPDLYLGSDPKSPAIGDIRVHFTIANPQNVTVLAQQVGNKLMPYKTGDGRSISYVKEGTVPLEKMLPKAKKADANSSVNVATGASWTARIIGLLLMSAGFLLLFTAVSTFSDKYARLACLKGQGGMIYSALASITLSVIIIAYSGFSQHPISSVFMILLLLGAGYMGLTVSKKKSK